MSETEGVYGAISYEDREQDYGQVTQEELTSLTEHVDWFYQNYIAEVADGQLQCLDGEPELRYRYTDMTTNAFGEPSLSYTEVSMVAKEPRDGLFASVYDISIARTIAVERQRTYEVDDSLYITPGTYPVHNAPLLERYRIEEYVSGEKYASCELLDLSSEHGQVEERPMLQYDYRQLVGEIVKLYELYSIYYHEHAKIDS